MGELEISKEDYIKWVSEEAMVVGCEFCNRFADTLDAEDNMVCIECYVNRITYNDS